MVENLLASGISPVEGGVIPVPSVGLGNIFFRTRGKTGKKAYNGFFKITLNYN